MHLSIEKKFKELGYNVLDLGRLWKHPEAVHTTPLTDRGKYLVPFTIFCVLTIQYGNQFDLFSNLKYGVERSKGSFVMGRTNAYDAVPILSGNLY